CRTRIHVLRHHRPFGRPICRMEPPQTFCAFVSSLDIRDDPIDRRAAASGVPCIVDHRLVTSGLEQSRAHPQCSTIECGRLTQGCLRSSYTETHGAGNVGSANAPTGIAVTPGMSSIV